MAFSFRIPKEKNQLILNSLTQINLSRTQRLASILCLLTIVFLYSDYYQYVNGQWSVTPADRPLFYTHLALGIGSLIYVIIVRVLNRHYQEVITSLHAWIIRSYAFFLVNLGAVVSGWIDQNIHGQITVYLITCFLVAVIYYQKPTISITTLGCSFLLFVSLLLENQHNANTLLANIGNAGIIVVLSCFLSLVFYGLKHRELQHMHALEAIVNERTKDLQHANELLRQEIAERQKSDEKVTRLASIAESSNDGVISISLAGIILDWNMAAEQIFGFSAQHVIGRPIRKLINREKFQAVKEAFRKLSQGDRVSMQETDWNSQSGKPIKIAYSAFPIRAGSGKISGYSIVVIDLTEKKRFEGELARLDRLNIVGEMAACICHEVRNPMTTVKGFLQLIRDKHGEKEQEILDLMISEMNRANAILSEFLAISRNKATRFELANLNQLIKALLPLIEAEAINNDQTLTVELDDVPNLQLDAQEIRQVVINLVHNGFEAMPFGGKLTIKTFVTADEVGFAVADQGGGIDQNVLEQLGTPFFTTKKDGTGLGLAVCEAIVARHNGRIQIETSVSGSTFYVYFKQSNIIDR